VVAGNLTGQRSYYGSLYELDPAITLAALVGHPNVFWEDRLHVPVEVVKGTPEVHIVPKGQKVRVSIDPYPISNPGDPANTRCVIKESPTRVLVLAFEPIHIKMAEILGREDLTLPKDRSAEALARLQGLSRHIPIQSDVALAEHALETIEALDADPDLVIKMRAIEIQHDSHARHILKSLVQPFILRRTKSQVLEDLPARTELITIRHAGLRSLRHG